MSYIELDEVDSTNDYVKRNLNKLPNLSVVRCNYQTNGRGRNGHVWQSKNGDDLLMSILVKDFNLPLYVMLATKNGQIKRTNLKDFEVTRYSKPLKCMGLKNDDRVVDVKLTDNNQGIILTTKAGYGALYSEQEVSIVGIKAAGIRAVNLKNDELVSLNIFNPLVSSSLIVISEEGGVKRIKIGDITPCNRATKGTLLYKNPKSKIIYVKDSVIVDNSQLITVTLNDQTSFEFKATDYNNANLEQKPSVANKLTANQVIDDVYINSPISTSDYDVAKKTEVDLEIFKQPKEHTLSLIHI